jgi:hypothetical protein
MKLALRVIARIGELGGTWHRIDVTLGRTSDLGPCEAYERCLKERVVSVFVQRMKRAGILTGVFWWWLEWQDGGWAHWHVMAQFTESGAVAVRDSEPWRGGKGIVAWSDEHVAPEWGQGFAHVRLVQGDLVRAVGYAVAYGAKDKEHELDLPPWVSGWLKESGRSKVVKDYGSRGTHSFWPCSEARESERSASQGGGELVTDRIEMCGQRAMVLVGVDESGARLPLVKLWVKSSEFASFARNFGFPHDSQDPRDILRGRFDYGVDVLRLLDSLPDEWGVEALCPFSLLQEWHEKACRAPRDGSAPPRGRGGDEGAGAGAAAPRSGDAIRDGVSFLTSLPVEDTLTGQ